MKQTKQKQNLEQLLRLVRKSMCSECIATIYISPFGDIEIVGLESVGEKSQPKKQEQEYIG